MVEIPQDARVYQSCRHAIAILIVVMYVDNNGLRTNAKELVQCKNRPLTDFSKGTVSPTAIRPKC